MSEKYVVLERSIENDLRSVERLYMQLDADRLRLVWTKAMQLKRVYRPQLEQFLEFLRELQRR